MDKKRIELPLIINGCCLYPSETEKVYSFLGDDIEVLLPNASLKQLKELEDIDTNPLVNVPVNEIIDFLSKVGKLWMNKDYRYRKLLEEIGPKLTGESKAMYDLTISLLIDITYFKSYLQNMIEAELNNKRILDEWVAHFDCYIRAVPLGNLLHIIAGNVPLASIYSVIRGLVTKNMNICKLPGRDIVTLIAFALSCQDVDKEHPVTKALSVLYWDRNELDKIEHYTSHANGICIWGGADTVHYYKGFSKPGTEVIEYGPKTGVQIIEWNDKSSEDLVYRVARDICVFSQEACFSPQIIYLLGDVDDFIQHLGKALDLYKELWKKTVNEIDHYAHMNIAKSMHEFCGNPCLAEEQRNWMIVNLKNVGNNFVEHPLGRTIYIHGIAEPKDCLKYINRNIQTVGIEPKSLAFELRDELVQRGVLRIANIGYVEGPRQGLCHDGVSIQRLVRLVGMERELEYSYQAYEEAPPEYEYFEPEYVKYLAEKGEEYVTK